MKATIKVFYIRRNKLNFDVTAPVVINLYESEKSGFMKITFKHLLETHRCRFFGQN